MPQSWLARLFGRPSNPSKRREGRDRKPRGLRDGEPRPPVRGPRTLSSSPPPPPRRRRLLGRSAHPPSSPPSLPLALPTELRLEIIKHVVGGHAIHLVQCMNRLMRVTHTRCHGHVPMVFREFDYGLDCDCIPCKLSYFPYSHLTSIDLYEVEGRDRSVLGLLQTCRRIYREGIALLYTANTFTLTNPRQRGIFPVVPPQGAALIRDLHITWGCPVLQLDQRHLEEIASWDHHKEYYEFHQWLWACEAVVKRMTGLKYLKVTLHGKKTRRAFEPISCADIGRMLAPLRHLRGLRSFEVLVMSDLEGYDDMVEEMRRVVCAKA